MRRFKRNVARLVLVFACLSGPLSAEESEEYSFLHDPVGYLGARVGFIELEDVDNEGSYNVGVMGGVFFLSQLSGEVSIDFQIYNLEIEFDDGTTVFFPEIERETVALQVGLDFMPFPEQPVRPYLVGGVGYYYSRYTSNDFPSEKVSDTGYFTGLGLDVFGDAWDGNGSLTVEARWLFTQKEEFAQKSIRVDGYSVSIGFRVKF